MSWIEIVVRAALTVLWQIVGDHSGPTSEDSAPPADVRDRLRDRIRQTWGATVLVGLALVLAVGCTRTIYVRPGDPVRLREDMSNVKVWVHDADGQVVPSIIDRIPEGWYAVADPEP